MTEGAPENLSLDELVVHAVWRVLNNGEDCTFERLVYEAFALFPKSFGLRRYPQWPDSSRVNKAWLRCRTDKGWIRGSVQEGFHLTDMGLRTAEKVSSKLSSSEHTKAKPVVSRARERNEAIIRYIRANDAFRRFLQDPFSFTITSMDLRSLLNGTLETPPRVLRQNLISYQDAARLYGDEEVVDFLDRCMADLRRYS